MGYPPRKLALAPVRKRTWSAMLARPMVPGHEVVGIVTKIGSDVTKVKVGDKAGVQPRPRRCAAST